MTIPAEGAAGQSAAYCFLLPDPVAWDAAQAPVGKLVPVLRAETVSTPFTRLDTFDQALRLSNRMLLEHGTTWEVFLPTGQTLSQSVARRQKRAADLGEGPVRQALADMSPLRHLLPFGSGTLRRASLAFADHRGKIRCRADLLCLTTGEAATATLVRLQGLRGYDKALATLRHHLQTCGGTAFSMTTLHNLLFPGQMIYCAKPALGLATDLTSVDAVTRIIASLIPVLVQNEAGILADLDTEFLHDYRVALRKIRSVLSLFKGVYGPDQTAALKARLSALMAQTGTLRDLDVQLLERQLQYDAVPPSLHHGLDCLFVLRTAARSNALTKLARHLNSRRHADDMSDLAQLFAAPMALAPGPKAMLPIQAMTSMLIWKRFKAARKLARCIGPDTSDEVVHDLRLQVKKLRYLLDFAADLYLRHALKPALRTIKHVQTHLGTINDLSVQLDDLQSVISRTKTVPDTEMHQLAQSLGALATVLHHRRREARHKTEAFVAPFIDPLTRDIFRALAHPGSPEP